MINYLGVGLILESFWGAVENEGFLAKAQKPIVSARKTRNCSKCLFAISYTPAMVSCKRCVFDRRRNYCILVFSALFKFVFAK